MHEGASLSRDFCHTFAWLWHASGFGMLSSKVGWISSKRVVASTVDNTSETQVALPARAILGWAPKLDPTAQV